MHRNHDWSNPPPGVAPLDHVPEYRGRHPIKRGLTAMLIVVGAAALVWFTWPFTVAVVIAWLWWEALQWSLQ